MKKILSYIPQKAKAPILLGIIILIAFVVRFEAAKRYHVMIDEAVLVMDSHRSFLDLFLLNYWNTAHPPLYDLIDKITVIIQGTTPFDIRIKSQIFGSLSLIFLFQIVFLLTKSIRTSIIATVFMIFSGFHVGLSAFNRPYGFQQFFVLGFLFYFLKIFLNQKQKNETNFALMLIFSALATFTDYSFLWILASIYFILLLEIIKDKLQKKLKKETIIYYLKTFFVTIFPFLLWLPIFISKLHSAVGLEEYLEERLEMPISKLVGMVVEKMFYVVYDDNFFIFTSVCIVLFVIFCLYKYIKSPDSDVQKTYIFLGTIGIVPLIVSLITSHIFSPVILSRNLFVCSYAYIIFFAMIISTITPKNKVNQIFLVLIIMSFQYLNLHTTIKANFNFNHSHEVLETRGIIFDRGLEDEYFYLGNSLPQSSWGVWYYYFDMLDYKNISKIKRVDDPTPKTHPKFYIISYLMKPQIPEEIIKPYECTNLNVEHPSKIQLFECILKSNQ